MGLHCVLLLVYLMLSTREWSDKMWTDCGMPQLNASFTGSPRGRREKWTPVQCTGLSVHTIWSSLTCARTNWHSSNHFSSSQWPTKILFIFWNETIFNSQCTLVVIHSEAYDREASFPLLTFPVCGSTVDAGPCWNGTVSSEQLSSHASIRARTVGVWNLIYRVSDAHRMSTCDGGIRCRSII